MSHSDQQNVHSQSGYYQNMYPSSNLYQDPQARNYMNPPGHISQSNYPDSPVSGYPQSQSPQPNMAQQPPQQQQQQQQQQPTQPHQVRYIPTPPLVSPGVFQNPNGSPFTNTPRTAVQTPSPQPIRYQCDKCGTTFSRSHDRNRHYESTHSENPPIHKCEKCGKLFSRADAKKRHQDDGKCTGSS